MKYITTLTLFITLVAAQSATYDNADCNWYYQSAGGTNMPPTPSNLRPGYEAVRYAGGWLVLDQASDLAVLARGLMSLDSESGDPPPVPGDETNAVMEVTDTNAWMGTWICGQPSPINAGGLPINGDPCIWRVSCTNASGSRREHVHMPWFNHWTKVCPGDTVEVLWPSAVTNANPIWTAFLIQQRGTNVNGRWTNNIAAVNDKSDRYGMWGIPPFPDPTSPKLVMALCASTNRTLACWVLQFPFTNSVVEYTNGVAYTNTSYGTNYVLTNSVIDSGMSFSCPITNEPPILSGSDDGGEGKIGTGGVWDPVGDARGRMDTDTSPEWGDCMKSLRKALHLEEPAHILKAQLRWYGRPGDNFVVEATTNLTTWSQSITNVLTFHEDGPGTMFWRAKLVP